MKLRHKFGAVRTAIGERSYASKAEARYAAQLGQRKAAGEVLFWLEQVPLMLPGGVKYVCDFQVFEADGSVRFVEVKGFETPAWKIKARLVAEAYPMIAIEVVGSKTKAPVRGNVVQKKGVGHG